jgi:hypothetical protein
MSTGTAGMYYTLWDPFVVKAVYLLSPNLILKERRTVLLWLGADDLEPDEKLKINTTYSMH